MHVTFSGNAINDIYLGLVLQHHYVALVRMFELLDHTQRHHLKEDRDTHGNKNSKKSITNDTCAELCAFLY